jgi:hypothetical protein
MKTEAEWRAEKEFKRDEAERKCAAAADPKEEGRLRAARDNYKRQLTMGRLSSRQTQDVVRDPEIGHAPAP